MTTPRYWLNQARACECSAAKSYRRWSDIIYFQAAICSFFVIGAAYLLYSKDFSKTGVMIILWITGCYSAFSGWIIYNGIQKRHYYQQRFLKHRQTALEIAEELRYP